MRFRIAPGLFIAFLVVFVLVLEAGGQRPTAATRANTTVKRTAPDRFAREILPLFRKHCSECHGPARQNAGINFMAYRDQASVLKARELFEKVSRILQDGVMPPKGRPQPTSAERERMATWIDVTLSSAECDIRDPGRVTLRRLNREEYNNTVRDLIGLDLRPAEDFPADDIGYGFDNIGDVLSVSPILLERYLAAAEKISEAAIYAPETHVRTRRFQAARIPETGGMGVVMNSVRTLYSNGEVTVDFTFPKAGEYALRARAYGAEALFESPRMSFRLDGRDLQTVEVSATEKAPQVYEARAKVSAGKQQVAVAFTNEFRAPGEPNPRNRPRYLVVDYLEIAGPIEPVPDPLPESHRRIISCGHLSKHNEDCPRVILTAFARRAYRRPVPAEEISRLTRYVEMAAKEGESFERGIQLAVQAALVSPNFLFKIERDQEPSQRTTQPSNHLTTGARPLDDHELASRLSYFLWSSMPDEELFALADKRRLRDPKVLQTQTQRMLAHPKSSALALNFGGQWLHLRSLALVNPDRKRFPQFDDELRAAMRTETEMFFDAVMREDRSILEFIDGKLTFLNERLAQHYGISGVHGDRFRKVALNSEQRSGVLTHASILTVTSNPTRTSPVKRGKWVLEQIFGTPPPPPPPGVEDLKEDEATVLSGTLRQRMLQHRENPSCATCHTRMDPLGFGLENYDAIGAWRTTEGKFPIDASGELPGGKKFQGPAQLKVILKSQSKQFTRALAEKMLTYALGRGPIAADRCAVDDITKAVIKDNHRFSALVREIVKSEPFRMRSKGT